MRIPRAEKMLRTLILDPRLKAYEKFLLLVLPILPANDDGSYQVSARYLAMVTRSTERTASRGLRALESAGYIEIESEGSSSKGGFKIFFRRAGLLLTFLSLLNSQSPALHKLLQGDTARTASSRYILSDRRKRRSKRQSIELEHESIDRYTRAAKHPLGQLAISTHTPAQIGAKPESDRSPGRSLS
jgi:hypothetical protein